MASHSDSQFRSDLKDVAANCLCRRARNASRSMTRFYDRHFAGSDMEPTQFTLLVAIAVAQPVPLVRLANHLGMERTTLTRNLTLLERKKWIELSPGEDARQRMLALTPAGRRAIEKGIPLWKSAQRAAVEALGKENFARLSEALTLVRGLNPSGGPDHEA